MRFTFLGRSSVFALLIMLTCIPFSDSQDLSTEIKAGKIHTRMAQPSRTHGYSFLILMIMTNKQQKYYTPFTPKLKHV